MRSSASSSASADNVVTPTIAPLRNGPCGPTPTGSVSYQDDTRACDKRDWSRPTANARCDSRSPTLLPSAMATLFNPAGIEYLAATLVDGQVRPDDVGAALRRLLEQTTMLEHLAEDDAQHALVTRVGHLFDRVAPF